MIDPELLPDLRCPIDPARQAGIILDGHRIVCQRCAVRFPSRDGIVNFVVRDAVLPEGCGAIGDLPCRQTPSPATEG